MAVIYGKEGVRRGVVLVRVELEDGRMRVFHTCRRNASGGQETTLCLEA